MRIHGRFLFLIWLLLAIATAGCGSGTAEKTAAPDKAPVEKSVPTPAPEVKPAPVVSEPPPKTAAAGLTPDAAVRAVLDGPNDKTPKAVWDFLPASYQHDVNELVHQFGKNVDAELWQSLFRVSQDAVQLLRTKKEFILSYPRLKENPQVDAAELEKKWDSTVAILTTLSESDLSDPVKLQTMDVGVFLATTGQQLMTQLAALSRTLPDDPLSRQFGQRLEQTRPLLIESKDETAIVRLTPVDPKTPPTDVPFVRIEGKWIPRSLAEGWKPGIDEVRQRISILGGGKPAQHDATQATLSQLAATVAELQAIETADEFHQRLDEELPKLAMLFEQSAAASAKSSSQLAPAAPSPASREASVTIAIDAPLDEQAEDLLCSQLIAITENPDVAVTEAPNFSRGQTTIRVWPVADVAAFAKQINFARVIKVDNDSRTIVLELNAKAEKVK